MDVMEIAKHRLGIFLALQEGFQQATGRGSTLEAALIEELTKRVGQAKVNAITADAEKLGENSNNIVIATLASIVDESAWCKCLEQAAAAVTSVTNSNGLKDFDLKEFANKLQEKAAGVKNNREAALNEPYHLFFFSAVDRDGVDRFFDVMEQKGDFSVAETARYAPRLGQCTETTYESPDGVMHHVHRNYGKYRNVTLHQAMQHFAGMYGLVSLAEIAQTHNHLQALPTWDMIFARLTCPAGAFVPNSVTQHIERSTEMTERTGTSSDGHAPESMLDFDKMTPVVAGAELPDGFVRVIMPDGKCFDILEELWTEARRIEPGCVIMSRKATGTRQN